MKKVYVHECGGNLNNRSTEIEIPNCDFALVVGDKSYRFEIDRDDNLILPLINGADCKITTYSNYPAVKLINQ